MSILKNYSYNLLYQITIIILPIISIPYVSRIIGAEGFGVFAFTTSITQYFSIFANLGLSIYASREIAYVKHDIYKRSNLFSEIVIIQFSVTLIVLIAFYIYIFAICKTYANIYLIQSISILSIAFDISWFYIGIEDFKKNVLRNVIVKFSAFILLFILIKTADDLWKYILLTVASIFFGQIYMWLGIGKYIKKIPLNNLQIFKHINKAKFFFLIVVIGIIGTNLNKTLIGLFVNNIELGKYDIAYKLIMMSLVIITSLGSVMTPRIAATYSKGDLLSIKYYLKLSLQFTFFFSFLVIPILILISEDFVLLFLGSQFKGTGIYLIMLCPIILLNSLSNLLANQYMIPSGNEKKYFNSLIIGFFIGTISSIILISKFSVIGACISVLIGESVILLAHLYQVRDQTILQNIIGKSWQFVIASLPIYLLSYFHENLLGIPAILILIQIGISFTIYFGMLYLLKNEFLKYALDKFKSIIKSKS